MLVISTFPIKMLDSSRKGDQKISIFNKFEPTQGWISFSTLLEHPKKLIFKVKIIITCILRSILLFQRREHGVLGSVTYVLLHEVDFFRLAFESRGFKHYILQISSRQLLLWTSTEFLKNGFKNRWFFCKKFQHVCLII